MKRFALLALLLALFVLPAHAQEVVPVAVEYAFVVRVIDGDTIEVSMYGQTFRVRYIGVDTPEQGEDCAAEASAANAALVEGRPVAMIRDVSETDRNERLLRYVFSDGAFVNAALVAEGWARSVRYPPDTAFADWFDYLESQASEANLGCHARGIWDEAASPAPTATVALPTSTPAGVTVTAQGNVNLRQGPGTEYTTVGVLTQGQTVRAYGRNAGGNWLIVDTGHVSSWVATWVVAVSGDVNSLPVMSAPPTPTWQPPAATRVPQATQPPAAGEQPSGWNCSGDIYNCSDFRNRCADLCSYWRACPGDPSRLDADGDGWACESYCPPCS